MASGGAGMQESAPRPGPESLAAKAVPYSVVSHLGHVSAGGCSVGPVTSLCAMRVTAVSLFLRIIGIAASVGALGCRVQDSCCTWLLPVEQKQWNASSVSPAGQPFVRGRSARHTGHTWPGSSVPCERRESSTSGAMESKSSRLPVLRECFVGSVTPCYGC